MSGAPRAASPPRPAVRGGTGGTGRGGKKGRVLPTVLSPPRRDLPLRRVGRAPLPLDELIAGTGPWEVEIGFGKGRYLLERAAASPERRFLGIEMAAKYQRLLTRRARRRGLANLLTLRGEALYLLSAVLPRRFAAAAHVYFPDPWPKSRHHKRRLFDPETVDLVLGLLAPGATLSFATDHRDYGNVVREILSTHPRLRVVQLSGPWPDGARTNYEAKYMEEGRPITRLVVIPRASLFEDSDGWRGAEGTLHPAGAADILVAPRHDEVEDDAVDATP